MVRNVNYRYAYNFAVTLHPRIQEMVGQVRAQVYIGEKFMSIHKMTMAETEMIFKFKGEKMIQVAEKNFTQT